MTRGLSTKRIAYVSKRRYNGWLHLRRGLSVNVMVWSSRPIRKAAPTIWLSGIGGGGPRAAHAHTGFQPPHQPAHLGPANPISGDLTLRSDPTAGRVSTASSRLRGRP